MLIENVQYLIDDLKSDNTKESKQLLQQEATTHNIEKALLYILKKHKKSNR